MAQGPGDTPPPSLDEVRKRIDAIDADLLRLVVERSNLAHAVAAAKAASGDAGKFGLRPGRETMLLRRLLAGPRNGAKPALIVRIWRELIGDSLATQGPFHIAVWGGKDPARAVEVARLRFGVAASLRQVAKPAEAATLLVETGGLKLYMLAGFYQPDDARLARAPGKLSGVIGAAPAPLDV